MGDDEEVVLAARCARLATAGHQVLRATARKAWGEGLNKNTVCSYTLEDGRIAPTGVHAVKTPVSHDSITAIVLNKAADKGWAGFHSGRVSPFGAAFTTDCSWAAHNAAVGALVVVEGKGKELLWSASADGLLRIWDGAKLAGKAAGHRGAVVSVVHVPFASSGGIVWSAGQDKTIRVWDKAGAAASGWTKRPTALKCADVPTSLVVDAAQQIVWSSEKGAIRGWSADTRTCVWSSSRGGASLTLCGGYLACLSDAGGFVLLWNATVTPSKPKHDVPSVTAIPTHDKTLLTMASTAPSNRLLLSSERGLTLLDLQAHRVDPACEVVLRKATDESVGAIFRSDDALVLERVEANSSAERCGTSRFVGWSLASVNGVSVRTVTDVRACVRRQSVLTLKFRQAEGGEDAPAPAAVPAASGAGSNWVGQVGPGVMGGAGRVVKTVARKGPPGKKRRPSEEPGSEQVEAPPTVTPARRRSPGKRAAAAAAAPAPAATATPEWAMELAGVVRRCTNTTLGEDELPGVLEAHLTEAAERQARLTTEHEAAVAALVERHAAELEEVQEALREQAAAAAQGQVDAREQIREEVEASLRKLVTPSIQSILSTLAVSPNVAGATGSCALSESELSSLPVPPPQDRYVRATVARSRPHHGSDASFEQLEQEAKEYSRRLSQQETQRSLPRRGESLESGASQASDTHPHPPPRTSFTSETATSQAGYPPPLPPRQSGDSADFAAAKVQEALDAVEAVSGRMDVDGVRMSLRRMQGALDGDADGDSRRSSTQRSPELRRSTPPPGSAAAARRHRSEALLAQETPEATDLRKSSSPTPLTHGVVGSTADDEEWSRLFDLKNKLEQWLQEKPAQIHTREQQLEREAHAEGSAAVHRAAAEYDDYVKNERRAYGQSLSTLKHELAPMSPSLESKLDESWGNLEAAEAEFTSTLAKLREEHGNTKVQAAMLRKKICEFKRFLDDATRTYDAAVAEYPSEKLADGDLRSAVLACVGLDLWCLSRFHVHNAAAVREDVARTPHDTHIAVVADELRTAEELWEALERRLVAAPPATELSASSDLVWVLLELAKAAVKLDVSTDLAFKAANRVTTALLPALQQRLVRLADADADDDLVPALETLCDEIVRYYALGLTPMLDVNAKLAGQTGELADTIGTDLKRSCRFRSHHMHRTQLHAAQITNVLHRIAKEEFGARAVGMDERAVNDLLDASLTKGGTMVVMPTFRQHAAHELLKLNHARSVPYSLDASPRTSLEALVVFFNTRVGRRAEAPGAAQAPPPGGSALDDAHCSPLRQSGGRMSY